MVKQRNTLGDTLGFIEFKGEFDYEELYTGIYNWYQQRRFMLNESYKHKMTGKGAEVELDFKGGRKITDFLKYKIDTEIKIWDMVETEVIKDGKKQKLNKGRMRIILKWEVVLDYSKQFKSSEFFIRLFNMMAWKFMKKKIILDWAGTLIGETYMLHTEIKKLLKMETAYSAW